MSLALSMRWHSENKRNGSAMIIHLIVKLGNILTKPTMIFPPIPCILRYGFMLMVFAPNNQFSKPYSCWPVLIMPYNLPLEMCMKDPYLFLTCMIRDLADPKAYIDICLQPLIDELNELGCNNVLTNDISMKLNFMLRVALMWTINDFPWVIIALPLHSLQPRMDLSCRGSHRLAQEVCTFEI